MSKPEFAKINKTKITAESGKQELEIIREFDAPRELVFKAYTDPDLYRSRSLQTMAWTTKAKDEP